MAGGMIAPTGGGSGRRRVRRRHAPIAEINVTPFVDVMLVLLIIFMVTAPLLTVGVPIDLPETEAKAMEGDTEPITVSVSADGQNLPAGQRSVGQRACGDASGDCSGRAE